MERREDDFALLNQKAMHILMDGLRHDFFLSVQPSFENFVSWSVSQDSFIRQVIWDRIFDTRRFRDPMEGLKHGWHIEPTMTIKALPLDLRQFNLLMEKGRKLKLPPKDTVLDKNGVTIDGTRWILKFSGVTVNWNTPSKEWLPLVNWAEKAHAFLMSATDLPENP